MHRDFSDWLEGRFDVLATRQNHRSQVRRIETHYGSLDEILGSGGLESVRAELIYTAEDERLGRQNPSKFPIDGNLGSNLAAYKSSLKLYEEFWIERGGALATDSGEGDATVFADDDEETALDAQQDSKQRLALERDMQVALRADIAKLEAGLTIVDDGAERSVQSGFIDILCRDEAG